MCQTISNLSAINTSIIKSGNWGIWRIPVRFILGHWRFYLGLGRFLGHQYSHVKKSGILLIVNNNRGFN